METNEVHLFDVPKMTDDLVGRPVLAVGTPREDGVTLAANRGGEVIGSPGHSAETLLEIHRGLAPAGDHRRLATLSELAFDHALQSGDRLWYGMSAIYAYALLFPGDGEQTILLLDHRGVPRAGIYVDSSGEDVTAEVGMALGSIGLEATRAMRHLGIGEWKAIVCECGEANLGLAPADDGDVILVAAAPSVPQGFVRRLLDMASRRALAWRREVA